MTPETLALLESEKTDEQRRHDRAFALVVPEGADWRDPIAYTVTAEELVDSGVTLDAIKEAVVFYTATKATIEKVLPGVYRVKAVGYRMGPAGDH